MEEAVVRARIRVSGGTHVDLLSLRDRLAATPEFHDRVTFELPGAQPGEKGGMATVVLVTLSPGGPSALVGAVAEWLDGRESDVAVEITAPDGAVTEVVPTRPARG
jgi:hypothetical protein